MKRQSWLMALLATVLILAGCAGSAPSSSGEGQTAVPTRSEPAILRVGWPGSPDNLNPGMGELYEAYVIYSLVYDTIYELGLDGKFRLNLAESMTTSDDGKVHTFKIRQGVKFSDGQPLTANDVSFSLNLYKDHAEFPFLNSYTQKFDSISAPDDTTVVLTLTAAIPNLDSQLLSLYILPEHIWKEHSDGTKAAEFQNLEMIGSGPFILKEYKQNEFVRVVVNKEHYKYKPQVDEIVFQSFGNEDALVQALVTGQVDMITRMPNTAVPVLKRTKNVEVVAKPGLSPQLRDVIFNQATSENCPKEGGKCTGHPALLDRNVRLALAHATDKQSIIDTAMLGLAKPGLTLVASGQANWYNSQIKDYEFDIAKANKILDDAGYKDTNGDGVREMPDGSRPLEFRLQWPNNIPEAPRVAELLGQTWSQIGVKTQPQSVDASALVDLCCPAYDYDIMIWSWYWGPDPNDPLGVMSSAQIDGGGNETGYSNPEYDKLFEAQSVELDPAKRQEIVFQMQQMVFDNVVYIIPYYPDNVQAYRTDHFSGWPTDTPTIELGDVSVLTSLVPVQ